MNRDTCTADKKKLLGILKNGKVAELEGTAEMIKYSCGYSLEGLRKTCQLAWRVGMYLRTKTQ